MIFPKGPDPRRLLEEQAAFEEAERRRAEMRARAIFDSLIDSSPVAIEIFDNQGNLTKSNKAAERLLGKVPPPGINLFEEKGLKRTGLLEPQLKRVFAGARVETPPIWYDPGEIGLMETLGKKVCFRATAFPLLDAEGAVRMVAVVYEDLTELKKTEEALQEIKSSTLYSILETPDTAISGDVRDVEFARRKVEQALRESEERYRALLESARDICIVRFADDGRIIAISPSVQEIMGVSREAVMTDNSVLFAQVHPEDITKVRAVEAEVRKTGEYPQGHQFRVVKKPSGAVGWVEMRGRAVTFASRRTFEVFILDITFQKRLEERLEKKEADITTLLQSPNDGFMVINNDWVVTAWSKGAEKETRISSKEAMGKKLWDIYPELEQSGMAAPFRKTMLEHQPQYQEFFYSDGRERMAGWFALSTYPFDSGVFALIRNITARKRIEMAWQEAESRLNAVINNPMVLIAYKDRSLRYIAANAVAQKLLGGATGEVVGKTDAELFPATVTALLGSHDRQVLSQGISFTLELALGDPKSETTVWLALTKQPWCNSSGEVIGILDIGFDITRLVHTQQELARQKEEVAKFLTGQEMALQHLQDAVLRKGMK